MRNDGKRTCDIRWISAYLEAVDEAERTSKPAKVRGFGGFKVVPIKDRDKDLD